jgi:cytochrome d ubiquinol oxidase subunit II
MTVVAAIALLLGLGLTAYALLGGADFGGGVWDLLAFGPKKQQQREVIAHSMGPVWEANHVWLVFVLIGLFSAFPLAFASYSRALALPLSLALLGIVLRGSAFVFRQYGGDGRMSAAWGRVFAVTSTITPFVLGAGAASVATGRLAADGSSGLLAPFQSALSISAGALAVSCTAYLAAVFLCRDAELVHKGLGEIFRTRALGAAVVTGALAVVTLIAAATDAPTLFHSLTTRGLVFMAVSIAGGILGLWLLWRRAYKLARLAAGLAPTGVLWGWWLAQYPALGVGNLDLPGTAAPPAVVLTVGIILFAGISCVIPALVILFRVFSRPPA